MHHSDEALMQPGNRPVGMPGNARFSIGGILAELTFLSTNGAGLAAVSTNDPLTFNRVMEPLLFVVVVLLLAIGLLLNSGRLWAVKLYHQLATVMTAFYAVALASDLVLWGYLGTDRAIFCMIGCVAQPIYAPFIWLMWRDFKRCRWLDPTSLPHEWEIAALRDPNSINYRPNQEKKEGGRKRR